MTNAGERTTQGPQMTQEEKDGQEGVRATNGRFHSWPWGRITATTVVVIHPQEDPTPSLVPTVPTGNRDREGGESHDAQAIKHGELHDR